jgi:hypothetical protein
MDIDGCDRGPVGFIVSLHENFSIAYAYNFEPSKALIKNLKEIYKFSYNQGKLGKIDPNPMYTFFRGLVLIFSNLDSEHWAKLAGDFSKSRRPSLTTSNVFGFDPNDIYGKIEVVFDKEIEGKTKRLLEDTLDLYYSDAFMLTTSINIIHCNKIKEIIL